MGIIIRQSLKTSLVSYLGVAIGAFNLMWLYPKFLAPEEIGLIRVVQDIAVVFVGLTHLGTLSITDKFFAYFRDHTQKHHGFLPVTLSISLLFFIFYCVLVLIFKDIILGFYEEKSPQIGVYFYYTIPLTFFMLYQLALDAYMRVHFRIVVSGFLREVFLRVMTGILVLAYFSRIINFDQLMIGVAAVYGLIVFILLYYIYSLNILYMNIDFRLIGKKFLKDVVLFYSYVAIAGFHRMIISRIDILMIPAFLGTKDVGIYSIALFIGAMIDLPSRAVNQISTPIIAQAWADNNIEKIQEVYQKSVVNQFIMGGLLFLGIWCNVDSIFYLMPKGEIYESGKYVILFIGLARLIEMVAGASDVIILHSKYYGFNTTLIIVLALLLFFTNLTFIPIFQIIGAALATALSIFLYTVVKFSFLWIKFRLQPFSRKSIWTVVAIGVTFIVVNALPYAHTAIFDILARSMIVSIVFMSIIVVFRVSGEINQLAYKIVGKLHL